jgi:hypothetical protein
VRADKLQHVNDKHIAVMCGGHFYIFQCTGPNGERLRPVDLERQLQWIVDDSKLDEPSEVERESQSNVLPASMADLCL